MAGRLPVLHCEVYSNRSDVVSKAKQILTIGGSELSRGRLNGKNNIEEKAKGLRTHRAPAASTFSLEHSFSRLEQATVPTF